MTFEIPSILGEKDGSAFRNKRVLTRYLAEDGVLLDLRESEATDFDELLRLRKQSQDPSKLEEALRGPGYQLANVGVSALIVANYRGENYLLFTKADRADRKDPDTVAKLLSGYVPADSMGNPENHLKKEIAEELLLMVDGKIMPGQTIEDRLDRPFNAVIDYSDETYFMARDNDFVLPGIKRGKILMKDGLIPSKLGNHAEFHVAADTNSGQVLFKYSMVLPNDPGLSLHHSEDKLLPQTTLLESRFHPEGILLIRLDRESKLTENVYTLANGKLKPYSGPINLTEAFAPKQNGISAIGSIGLDTYLANQK